MSMFAKPEPAAAPVARPGGAFGGKPGALLPGAPVAPAAPAGKPSSAFQRARAAVESFQPARVITLPASAWSQEYAGAARTDVQVGLRIYSEQEAVEARAAAAGRAWKLHPQLQDEEERVAAGNGALMAWLVAQCATKPGDRRVKFFGSAQGGAEDIVPIALTSGGLAFLFGELESLVAADSPTAPEADDEDVAWLVDQLQAGALDQLGHVEARRARRLLAGAISWMRSGE